MPELPEVESVRRQLQPRLAGRRVVAVWWDRHRQQRFTDVGRLVGRRVVAVRRRGKYLVCPLATGEPAASDAPPPGAGADLELVLNLGMTGSLRFDRDSDHDRARLHLDDGHELVFCDPRRFGRLSVVPAGDYADIPTLARLGPEPLTSAFDPDVFADRLRATTATVKAALLGQRLVAGVGNIYADESLWRSRIHPASRRVGPERAVRLHAALREVLAAAVEREGTTFSDYRMVNGRAGRYADFLDAYGQAGSPCARCGRTLRKTTVAQRGTTYCPGCQRI